MSRETNITTADGLTLYQTIEQQSTGQYWNGAAFEPFAAAHWHNYALSLTKTVLSANVQANYSLDFPAAIATAGSYQVNVYIQCGSAAAPTDGPPQWAAQIDWTGTGESSAEPDNASGNGSVAITAESDPSGGLFARDSTGAPISGVTVTAYLASDYNQTPRLLDPVAATSTRDDGGWVGPMMLDPAVTYCFTYFKAGFNLAVITYTVPAS